MIKIAPKLRGSNKNSMDDLRAMAGSPGSAAANRIRSIKRDTESLMATMKEIHGGRWKVSVDHDAGFVLVSRDFVLRGKA